jgi:hypothetical protein
MMLNTELSESDAGSVLTWRRRRSSSLRESRTATPASREPTQRRPRRSHAFQVDGVAQRGRDLQRARAGIAEHHAAAVRAYPHAALVGGQCRDPAVGECAWVAAVVAQLPEFVAVEAIQTVLGAEPHEALGILNDGIDRLLRESFLQAVALHGERRRRIRDDRGQKHHRADDSAPEAPGGVGFSPLLWHWNWNNDSRRNRRRGAVRTL